MNTFYRLIKIKKQSLHQRRQRLARRVHAEHTDLIQKIRQLRSLHPNMNCRDMYRKIQPENMGRDRFERFCKAHGFYLPRFKNFQRTTDSSGVIRFPNLLAGKALTGINQAWVSDITYYYLNGRHYYITFIMDAFSRRILGYSVSSRLTCEATTLAALKMAMKNRGKVPAGIILHSDGGGQYYAKKFLELTALYQFRNSMCEYAWENGKAERINGIIKNNYLRHRNIQSLHGLVHETERSIQLYNTDKPHSALNHRTPVQVEYTIIPGVYLTQRKEAEDDGVIGSKDNRGGASSPFRLGEKKPQNPDVLNA